MATPNPTRTDATRPHFGTGRVTTVDLGPFGLEAGGPPLPLTLAYRHDGPGPGAPQVLVIHALTGSADAAGDWWTPLIGPGLAFDTDAVGVLCANLLGGNYGSTGPPSTNPRHGPAVGRLLPRGLGARRGQGPVGAGRCARDRPLGRRHRRLAGRDDRARGRAGAAGQRRPRRADRGTRGDRFHGHRLEPHPARARGPARRRGPRPRPPARDDHVPLGDRLRRAVRACPRAGRPVLDQLLPRPPGRQARRPLRPRHLPDTRPGDGRPRRRAGPGRDRGRVHRAGRVPTSASPAWASRETSSTARRRSRRWSPRRGRPAWTRDTASCTRPRATTRS